MEADFVTGPAKNLLEFAVRGRTPPADTPSVELSTATYQRGGGDPADNPFVARARQLGVAIHIIRETSRLDFSVIPQIAAILNEVRPDIVQTHNVRSHFLMRYSGLWRKYRWIGFHHGYTAVDLKMKIYNQFDRWSLQAPAHLITVCGPFKQQLEAQGVAANRISVRHNAINPFLPASAAAREAVRQTIPCAPGVPLLLMVSRLSHEKGHLDLLEALAMLKERRVKCHVVIVGEGRERIPIEAARERLGLQNDVTLAGHQNEVRPYYGIATLYLMPSHSEGSPNALLEAMAAGLPAIASRAGGIPEIMTDGETGILVPPKNPNALAAAIERLLACPREAQALAANALRETARFTPEAYHKALVEIYQGVLRKPAGTF